MRRMIQQTCHTALLKHTCLSTFILCTSFIIPYINLLVRDVYRKQKYLYLKLTHISNWSRLDHTLKHTVAADKVFFEEDNSRAPIPAAALLLWLVVQMYSRRSCEENWPNCIVSRSIYRFGRKVYSPFRWKNKSTLDWLFRLLRLICDPVSIICLRAEIVVREFRRQISRYYCTQTHRITTTWSVYNKRGLIIINYVEYTFRQI